MPEAPAEPPPSPEPRRRFGAFRRFVVRPFFWLLAVLAVLVLAIVALLQSDFLRRRAQALLVAQLTEITGRVVSAGPVRLSLMPLSVEVEDLVIPGRNAGEPPLATIARLRIAGEWEGLSGTVLRLSEVVIERPRFDLRIYPDGSTNLPDLPESGGGRRQLEVRLDALLVHAGEFSLNDQAIPLDLDAHQVHARLVRARGGKLRGDAIVERVGLVLPHARPIPVSVSGSIVLGPAGIEIESGRARAPGLEATASGPIGWGAAHRGDLRFAADGSTSILKQLGYIGDNIVADAWHADGSVWWGARPAGVGALAAAPGAPSAGPDAEKHWGVSGSLRAPRAFLFGRNVEAVDASATVDDEGVRIALAHAVYHGGDARGTMNIGFGGDTYPADLKVHVDGSEAQPLLAEQGVPFTALAGRVAGDFEYRFTFEDPVHGTGGGKAQVSAGPAAPGQISLGGDAALRIERGVLALDTLALSSARQKVTGSGRLDLGTLVGGFDFAVDSSDVGELVPLVPVGPGQLWLPQSGRGQVSAHLDLPAGATLTTTLHFALRDVAAPGLAAEQVRGDLELTARAVEGLRLEASSGERTMTVAGRVPIVEPSRSDPAEIGLEIAAHDWPLAQARPWLPADVAALPVEGSFDGRVSLHGPLAALAGEVVGEIAPASIAGFAVDHLHAKLRFDATQLRVESLVAALPAGDVRLAGSLRFADQALDLALRAPALRLAEAPLADYLGGVQGSAELVADIRGTVAHPAVVARVLGHDLAVLGHELGDRGSSALELDWHDDRLAARGSLLGLVDAEGAGVLARDHADLTLAVKSEALPRLLELATGAPQPVLTGGFAGALTVRSGATPFAATLELPTLHLEYGGLALVNREPVRLALAENRLRIESLWVGEVGTEAEAVLAGSLGLGKTHRLDLNFQSSLPGRWVTLVAPSVQMSGDLDVLASVRGTPAQPVWNGQGVVRGGRLIFLGFPHALEELDASLALEPTRLVIDGLQAKLGGGQILASGTVDLPGGPSPGDYRFQLRARQVQLRYPEGFVLRGDAELALAPTEGGRVIRGFVDLDRVYYLTDLKLGPAQLLRRLLQKQRLEIVETDELLASTQLNVTVRAPGAVRVRNNVANLRGSADLALRGTLAAPVVFGRVEIDPGGTVRYGDNDYEIDRAVVNFSNPYRIEPVFDIVARTTIDAYKVKLNLSGTVDRLKPVFSSDPPIPENEVLGLLATGQAKDSTASSTNDLAQGVGAEAFLYGQAASLVGQRVGNLFGLDSFRVEPLTGATSTLSSVRVTVGKRLRRNLYVTYSVDPSGTQEQIFKVEWQVRPELALILTQNGDGSYALDARWEKSY